MGLVFICALLGWYARRQEGGGSSSSDAQDDI
jgi:hypothetical protein